MPISEYVLPGDWVRPEGITLGPDNDFFSGSSADGTIYRCGLADPTAEIWLPAGTDGRTVALGMTLYSGTHLVVCGGKTGTLSMYDVASRELISQRTVDGYLNDVCVVSDHAYATDSASPIIWRFDLTTNSAPTPVEVPAVGPNAYLNGIVATADGSVLLVAAQGTEILWRVDLANHVTLAIATEFAADGLLLLDKSTGDDDLLLGVCTRGESMATAEFFLAALRLSGSADEATSVGTYQDPRFDTPTTLAATADYLLVVNAQLAKGPDAKPPFRVIAVPVPTFG
jgi:sugar lactone lactonase YvrE